MTNDISIVHDILTYISSSDIIAEELPATPSISSIFTTSVLLISWICNFHERLVVLSRIIVEFRFFRYKYTIECRKSDLRLEMMKKQEMLLKVVYEGNAVKLVPILETGVDPKIVNVDGCTPLYRASWIAHAEMSKLLINAGAIPISLTRMEERRSIVHRIMDIH